jgi:hypothetical protein
MGSAALPTAIETKITTSHSPKGDIDMRKIIASTFLIFATATSSLATTYNIVGGFSGGQLGDVSFDLNLEADFAQSHLNETAGLTILSLTSSMFPGDDPFDLVDALGFTYDNVGDYLLLGPLGVSMVTGSANDFFFEILGFTGPTPTVDRITDSISTNWAIENPNGFADVSLVSPVPISASLPLLLTGFATLAGIRLRKRRFS